jgi:hypothetical protein
MNSSIVIRDFCNWFGRYSLLLIAINNPEPLELYTYSSSIYNFYFFKTGYRHSYFIAIILASPPLPWMDSFLNANKLIWNLNHTILFILLIEL